MNNVFYQMNAQLNHSHMYTYIHVSHTGKFGDLAIDIGIAKKKIRHILRAIVDVTCLCGSASVRKCVRVRDGSVEVYPARKGASPGSAKLFNTHEEGSQVSEGVSERLFDCDSRR